MGKSNFNNYSSFVSLKYVEVPSRENQYWLGRNNMQGLEHKTSSPLALMLC